MESIFSQRTDDRQKDRIRGEIGKLDEKFHLCKIVLASVCKAANAEHVDSDRLHDHYGDLNRRFEAIKAFLDGKQPTLVPERKEKDAQLETLILECEAELREERVLLQKPALVDDYCRLLLKRHKVGRDLSRAFRASARMSGSYSCAKKNR